MITKEDKKSYFNRIASKRIRQRKAKAYYWNDITNYCNYFIHADSSVLEIGCGTGELLNQISAKRKVGIDFSEEMIASAKHQFPYLELHLMLAENIKLAEKFDVIILSNLIGYLDDIQKVFTNLKLVCHSGTKIIITSYNFLWEPVLKLSEWIGIKAKGPNQNWLGIADINNLLFLSGFDVYRNSRRMILPVYIPVLSEIFNGLFSKLPLFRLACINNFIFARPIQEKIAADCSVSVIIPVCNESENIDQVVLRMPEMGTQTELIFVESNSTDDSWEKIELVKNKFSSSHSIKSIRISEGGKNSAVKKGFESAQNDILMILDADLTVAPEDLTKFYEAIITGKGDLINGCRLVYPVKKEAMRFLNLIANKCFGVLFTWLLEQPVKDTLCGTKVIFKKDYERLATSRKFFGEIDPFGDFDLLFGAHKLNLSIKEVPVCYHERTYGRSNISRFKHGFLLLKMCFFAIRKIKFI